ncbi:MAG: site-specific integrase [Kiritimatiellia bacterium]
MKHRTGHLFKRGKIFYCRWVVEKKVFQQCLRDKEGNPITILRDAETARIALMAPFKVADEVSALESITGKLEGRRAEMIRLDDQLNPSLSIENAWETYEKSPSRPDSGPATLTVYALQWGLFERWMKEKHPDKTTMRDVTQEVTHAYATHLNARGVTANTFNKHIRLLTLVFRVLKDKAKILVNPWIDIQRKRLSPQSHRELSTDELRKVCQSAEGELRTILAFGLYLGTRLGDAATMDWGNIDILKQTIKYIPRKTARRTGKELTVPIHPVLQTVLAETPTAQRTGPVLPEMERLYRERGPYAVAAIIQKHFEKCGIITKRKGKGVRKVTSVGFHSLRHSAITLLREAGAPLSVTMAIVGHSSLAMHDTYSHAGESNLRQAIASLPHMIGDGAKPTMLSAPRSLDPIRIRNTLEKMTTKNWKAKRDELLAMLPKTEVK